MSESDLYPGVNRLQYFLARIGMIAAMIFAVTIFGAHSPVMKVLTLLLMIASVVLDVLRLRNIGLSQWWAFIRFLPFGNAVLSIGLQCAQPGWAETRELDSAGKQVLVFELVLIALLIFIAYWMRASIPYLNLF